MALGDKKKSYNVVLEIDTKIKIEEIARKDNRSTSYLINYILKQYIVNKEKSYPIKDTNNSI